MQLARAVVVQNVLERLRVTIEEVLVGHWVVRFVDVLQVREQRQARACSGKIGKLDVTLYKMKDNSKSCNLLHT